MSVLTNPYLEDHFAEEDCLKAAHRAAGVSRNTVIARFRAALQTAPARYLWRLRTERGAAMLGETGHTIAEIAYRCGFKSPFHFSRLLKEFLGAPPREIRCRAWSPPAASPSPAVKLQRLRVKATPRDRTAPGPVRPVDG